MRKDLPRDASTLIGDSDDDVLRRFADQDLDRRWVARIVSSSFDDSLDRVPQQLADDVLQVAQDVGERGLEVALEFDFWYGAIGTVRFSSESLGCLAAPLNHFLGVAAEEDLADEVRV